VRKAERNARPEALPGAITVEACVTVTLFMMLMFIFFGFFLMFTAQSMVAHTAMQTAESLAMDAWQIQKLQLNGWDDASVGRLISDWLIEVSGQTEEMSPNFVSEVEWWDSGMKLENAVSRRFLGYLTGGDETVAAKLIKAVKINSKTPNWLTSFDFSESKIVNGDLYVTVKYKLDYMFQIWGLENGVDVKQTAVSHLWMKGASGTNTTSYSESHADGGGEAVSVFSDLSSYSNDLAGEGLRNATSSYYGSYREGDWADRGYYDFEYLVDGQPANGFAQGDGFSAEAANVIFCVKDVEIDGQTRKMINISIRGTEGAMDWVRDFVFASSDGMHAGFKGNLDSIFKNESNIYFDSLGMSLSDIIAATQSGNSEYFINVNGHSLGGAVANMYAKELYDRGVSAENMIGYTYASPLPYESGYNLGADYPIYNIVNDSDFVTHVGVNGIDNGKRAGTDLVFGTDDADETFRNAHYGDYREDKRFEDVISDPGQWGQIADYEQTRHAPGTYEAIVNEGIF
jgi:hypothetical protein